MNLALNTRHQEANSLLAYLKVLRPFLDDEANTEIVINRPGQVITESDQGWRYHEVPELTFEYCKNIARLTASYTNQDINEKAPILSATLPHGERVQVVIPPATRSKHISFTIRKPSTKEFSMDDYEALGFFDECEDLSDNLSAVDQELLELKRQRRFKEFLTLAVRSKKNIVLSGSTGSGKTTFFKSLVRLIPDSERLLSIENVDELKLYNSHSNTTSLFYSAGGQGTSDISQQELLESSLRMKPDRLFLAELIRGDEAFYYLRNVNSGHPGSITTMHANSARLAIEQLVLFLKESQSGASLSREDIKQLIFMCVDIIVQIKNINGKRRVTEIYYDPSFKQSQIA